MIIKRSEAIIIASFIEYYDLPENARLEMVDSAIAETGSDAENKLSEERANQLGRKYVEIGLKIVTNAYLSLIISNRLGSLLKVTGKETRLFECFCCGYKTLTRRGEYEICPVCWWEDDGGNVPEKISSVNHMTLNEAKANFKEFSIIEKRLLDKADKNRFKKYMKD